MTGRQMEGDNRYRRKRARKARERGKLPSEEAATLGASKQRHHLPFDPHVRHSRHHLHEIETMREGKQRVIRQRRPEARPRSRRYERSEHPATRHEHL